MAHTATITRNNTTSDNTRFAKASDNAAADRAVASALQSFFSQVQYVGSAHEKSPLPMVGAGLGLSLLGLADQLIGIVPAGAAEPDAADGSAEAA